MRLIFKPNVWWLRTMQIPLVPLQLNVISNWALHLDCLAAVSIQATPKYCSTILTTDTAYLGPRHFALQWWKCCWQSFWWKSNRLCHQRRPMHIGLRLQLESLSMSSKRVSYPAGHLLGIVNWHVPSRRNRKCRRYFWLPPEMFNRRKKLLLSQFVLLLGIWIQKNVCCCSNL